MQTLGRFDDMLQASEQARALDVTNVRAWNNAGIALAGLKSYAEALEAFEQTLTLDPTESWYWGNKARVLTHLRRYEEGLEAIDKALTLAPNDPHLWGAKIRILRRMRRFRQMWQAMVHTSTLQFTPRELPEPTEDEDAAEKKAYSLRGLWFQMLLVPWRRLHPATYATTNADTALVERVVRWGIWLIGLSYLVAGLSLCAVWLAHAGGDGGFVGTALRTVTTGLGGLLAQVVGAGVMLLVGRVGERYVSMPEGPSPLRTYFARKLMLIPLVMGILAIPAALFVYALMQAQALSGANRQLAFMTFLSGMALVAVIVLVVNRMAARKTVQQFPHPTDSRLTNS